MPGYKTNRIQLPVCGLEAVVRGSYAEAENQVWESREKLEDALPRYWAALTEELGDKKGDLVSEEVILDLLTPDQEYLAIEIYKVSCGPILRLSEEQCPDCKKPAKYDTDLDELDDMPIPKGGKGPDPTWEIQLGGDGPRVVFGYRTGKQERQANRMKSGGLLRPIYDAIRTVDGKKPKYSDVAKWPTPWMQMMRQAVEETRCGYDPRVRFTHECGHSKVVNLLMHPSFVFPGLLGSRSGIIWLPSA